MNIRNARKNTRKKNSYDSNKTVRNAERNEQDKQNEQNEIQMVIVVRKDLQLPKGKLSVQAAHAAVSLSMKMKDTGIFREWFSEGQKKIAVYVNNEKELLEIKAKAESKNIKTSLVRDAGRTAVQPGTITCIALGPGLGKDFEGLTSHLKLV